VVISYRRFEATYWLYPQGSRIQKDPKGFLDPKNGTDRLSQNIGKKLPLLAK